MKTRIYRNLTRKNWSIKQNGKVVGHCTEATLYGVKSFVSDKSHDRLRAAEKREVFAWLEGDLCSVEGFEPFNEREVITDGGQFHTEDCTDKITFHPFAEEKRGFFWVGGEDFTGCEGAYFTADMEVFGA